MQINQKLSVRLTWENKRPYIRVIPSKRWVKVARYNILWSSGYLHFAGTWQGGTNCLYPRGGTVSSTSETLYQRNRLKETKPRQLRYEKSPPKTSIITMYKNSCSRYHIFWTKTKEHFVDCSLQVLRIKVNQWVWKQGRQSFINRENDTRMDERKKEMRR